MWKESGRNDNHGQIFFLFIKNATFFPLQAEGKNYHPTCWKCGVCGRILTVKDSYHDKLGKFSPPD
jgi:hypothetical protein